MEVSFSMKNQIATFLLGCLLLSGNAFAESTRYFQIEGFGALLNGEPESVSLDQFGKMGLPPETREIWNKPDVMVTASALWRGGVVIAQREAPHLLWIDVDGSEVTLVENWHAPITALSALGSKLVIGQSAPGALFEIAEPGKEPTLLVDSFAEYVWALEADEDGLLIGTGQPAMVMAWQNGNLDVEVEVGAQHVRSFSRCGSLGIVVGGAEPGIVYRQGKEVPQALSLFDTEHQEITAVTCDGDYVYAAGATGAENLSDAEGSNAGVGRKRGKSNEVRSQLFRIDPQGAAEVLAGSNDEIVFDVLKATDSELWVATGAMETGVPFGRIYSVGRVDRKVSMVGQLKSRVLTEFVEIGPNAPIIVVGAYGGRLTELKRNLARRGTYMSAPFHTEINARIGAIELAGMIPPGTAVTAQLRTGQTSKPDETWTDWSEEVPFPGGSPSGVWAGNYVQVKISLKGNGEVTPEVSRIRLAYLRKNLPPFIKEVVMLDRGLRLVAAGKDTPKSKTVDLTGTISTRDSDGLKSEAPDKLKARQYFETGALTLRWTADDPNGDALRYDLWLKPESEKEWTQMLTNVELPYYSFDSQQLPDGYYRFKVLATDAVDNTLGNARSDERISDAVLVDHSAPVIDDLRIYERDGVLWAQFEVEDGLGPLTQAMISINGGVSIAVPTVDGVLDGPSEKFDFPLLLNPGAKLRFLTVTVVDGADNVATAQAEWRD